MSGPSEAVRRRAGNRCEYCHLPQEAFRRGFHTEHIVARQHGGPTSLDNLAFACWSCNLKKGPNLSGIDPATGHGSVDMVVAWRRQSPTAVSPPASTRPGLDPSDTSTSLRVPKGSTL
jgi:hypothetical protein